MNQLERFAEVAKYCHETYQRSRDDSHFDRNFFWRTPEEIKASGKIHYLCCSERTLMISQHALEEGLNHKLGLLRVKRFLKKAKFGTALEIVLDGVKYKFISGNRGDLLKPGGCLPDKKRTHVYTADVSLEDSKNYFGHFEIYSVDELGKILPGVDFDRFVKKVRRKSGKWDFKRHMRKVAKHRAERKYGLLV